MSQSQSPDLIISRFSRPFDYLLKSMKPKKPCYFSKSAQEDILKLEPNRRASRRPQSSAHKNLLRGSASPVPEFAKDFIYNLPESKERMTKSLTHPIDPPLLRSSLYQTGPVTRGKPRTNSLKSQINPQKSESTKHNSHQRSKSNIPYDEEPTLHKILRLYRPLIMNFNDKSKIRVFTTVSSAVRRSKEKLIKARQKKKSKSKKRCKDKQQIIEANDAKNESMSIYNKPASTFGEKLWRLNELSVLNDY